MLYQTPSGKYTYMYLTATYSTDRKELLHKGLREDATERNISYVSVDKGEWNNV
jgi:hypothetical protein